ncbi:hypothetical protein [Alteraurantiacibacter aquimixticola]|uniref:Uncharacterized protein n=1 Tax=Alteraurantiacibacter aquimixticola TaxID=2489173 RepID=A0A4T3EXX1_9SPHN|nr:hypothetical protein [Alteraurantiacibacter aquimixticola]TIX49479.1 hypothetical protein E5222_11550 [Alteraurantiacibacter aquimixticola]
MGKRVTAAIGLGLGSMAIAAAAQQSQTQTIGANRTEVARPADLDVQVPQDSVLLRQRDTSDLLQAMPVRRRLSLQAVRAQPVIELEQGTADMRPVLENRAAPVNLAQRLRASPQLVSVEADNFEIAEVPQGIVVRQYVAYSLQPGACSNPAQRRAVAEQGVQCFTRSTPAERNQAFASSENSARFVGDRGERQRALAEAGRAEAEQQAQIDADIAQLRANFADPAQRAEIAAQIGAAEIARLETLSDEDLQAAIINTAEVEIEEVMFVPNVAARDLQIEARPGFGRSSPPGGGEFGLAGSGGPQASSLPPAHRRGPDGLRVQAGPITGASDFRAREPLNISEDIAIDREIYLTGFTYGRAYEWRRRVSVTIAWCFTGCRRTYYVEPYAGFSYGFGLRFPIRMEGTYRYRHQNGNERASFVPQFMPIDGSVQDYSRAGIANSQLFGGQELVAEATANSGLVYKLPHGRQGDLSLFDVGLDLTDRLPAPFANGQLLPPSPGDRTDPVARAFESVDLLLNRGNFGAVGARVHPAVQLRLVSDGLSFTLRDHVADSQTRMNRPGEAYPLAVNANHVSRFSVSDPVYNLGFELTPGLIGRAFVDISLWSNHWDWPVWFPQLAVRLPPDGIDFSCHDDTTCSHQYRMQADYWSAPTRTNPPPRRTNPEPTPQRSNPAPAPRRTNPSS